MDQSTQFLVGRGEKDILFNLKMANRHGLIAGATGTGKTITLKVLAEHFSTQGVPVFLSDVKGDLASLAQPGIMNPKLQERIDKLGLAPFEFGSYPVRLWDVFGELGHPLRTSISEIGPLLLSRILGLNEVQAGVLTIIFRIADDMGLLLIDLKDIRSLVQYVGDNANNFTTEYGNLAKPSVGSIQRALLTLEDQGGDQFFAEPAFDINDLMKVDPYGKGIINVLASEKLMMAPALYSTFLLWLLSELFEELPEVGDLDKPKMVFFFDEAHLLFTDAPKALLDKIELVVRLIRSKGVGVYFVTQNPIDIPDKVLNQLGNRVQHALRSFTPRENKAINAMAETFRQNPSIDIPSVITELKTGEALVSMLDLEGRPGIVERAMICPPHSIIGTITPEKRQELITNSPFYYKYNQIIDKESAYEMLKAKMNVQQEQKNLVEEAKLQEQQVKEQNKEAVRLRKEQERLDKEKARAAKKNVTVVEKMTKSFMGTMSSSIGREIARGIFGSLLRR
ncbi:MAG: ATPase [Erysipelotrichaceae bacterium]|nr:MAG: hypothetical protein FD179_593 [Erysipelotrichaceae bacterium]TXT17714.1 MAG: ATPase [Erysipelotrichaceae bacterium]